MKLNRKTFIFGVIIIAVGIITAYVHCPNENFPIDNENNEIQNSTEYLEEKIAVAVEKNNSGDKDGALADYSVLLELDPTNILILNNIANIYSDKGEWTKSEEYFKKLVEAHPQRTSTYRSLGYLYQYRFPDSEDKIKELFDEGLVATNNHPDLLNWIISYYQEIGQKEKTVPYAGLLVDQLNEY